MDTTRPSSLALKLQDFYVGYERKSQVFLYAPIRSSHLVIGKTGMMRIGEDIFVKYTSKIEIILVVG